MLIHPGMVLLQDEVFDAIAEVSVWTFGLAALLGVYLFLCYRVGQSAKDRSRSSTDWFWVSFILSPLAAYVILLIASEGSMASAPRQRDTWDVHSPTLSLGELLKQSPQTPPKRENLRPCPVCAEMVQSAAIKCRFCGEPLSAPHL